MITCRRCFELLPEESFYKNSKGNYYYVCKDCVKKAIHNRYLEKTKDPSYVEKERQRGRDKYRRLGYKYNHSKQKIEKASKFTSLRNAKRDFKIVTNSMIELHHWNYNIKDCVICLNRRLHKRLHNYISISLDEGIYYYKDEKLNTLEKHMQVIKDVCKAEGFDFSDVRVIYKNDNTD